MKKWLFRFLALVACVIVFFLGIVIMDYFKIRGNIPMIILLGAIVMTWKLVNLLIIFTEKDKNTDNDKDNKIADN